MRTLSGIVLLTLELAACGAAPTSGEASGAPPISRDDQRGASCEHSSMVYSTCNLDAGTSATKPQARLNRTDVGKTYSYGDE